MNDQCLMSPIHLLSFSLPLISFATLPSSIVLSGSAGCLAFPSTICPKNTVNFNGANLYSSLFTVSGSRYREMNKNKQLNRHTDRRTDGQTYNLNLAFTRSVPKSAEYL